MSTNGTYLDRLIDSIMLPYKGKFESIISSEIVDVPSGETVPISRANCFMINVSDLTELEPSDLIRMSNGNNTFYFSASEYNKLSIHQNQVFRDNVQVYFKGTANAVARFEFVILQIVPVKSL